MKLVSAEGFEFIIDYKAACVSNTIRNMLSSQGALAVASFWVPYLAGRGSSACSTFAEGFSPPASHDPQAASRRQSLGKSSSLRSQRPSWRRPSSTFTTSSGTRTRELAWQSGSEACGA